MSLSPLSTDSHLSFVLLIIHSYVQYIYFFSVQSGNIIPIPIILWSVVLDFTQQADNDDDLIVCSISL